MGYVHCCSCLHSAKTFVLKNFDNYQYIKMEYLDHCPKCNHTVVVLTKIDTKGNISVSRFTNVKALKILKKVKKDILYELNDTNEIKNAEVN